jgi:hypothetical protein
MKPKIKVLSLTFTILVLLGIGLTASWAVPRVIEVKVLKTQSPPVIDGKLKDWPGDTSITGYATPADIGKSLQQWRGEPTPAKEEDCSLNIYAMWDEDNFYFAGQVVDEKVFLDAPSGDQRGCATGEVFEFYVDPLDVRDDKRGFGGTFGGTDKGPVLVQMDPLERLIDKALWEGAVVADKDLGPHNLEGWSFELRMNKGAFDPVKIVAFKANSTIGFTFMIKDDDNKEQNAALGAYDSVVQWPKGASDALRNDSMGGLILSSEVAKAIMDVATKLTTTWSSIKSQ